MRTKPLAKGAKRMTELGKKPSQVWFSAEEMELVKAASDRTGRKVAQFAKFSTLAEAARVLGSRRKQ